MDEAPRKPYPSDVSDAEWAFVAPSLTLLDAAAPQREHSLREVFNGLRWLIRAGATWPMMPHELPPWHTVYQQTRRWLDAGVFEALVAALRQLLRELAGRDPRPTAAVLDSRTRQSTPARGARAGYDGAKRRKGRTVHVAVDTRGHPLALTVTPADAPDRAQVGALAAAVRGATGEGVAVAFVDPGDTGDRPAEDAAAHGLRLVVVTLPQAKRGFVLLPRRWVVERSFAWAARFRRLARDYERLDTTLGGRHLLAFALIMARHFVTLMAQYA
jgi:transposase